jgi:ferredoxin-NADP reductase
VAIARTARIEAATSAGSNARALDLAMVGDEPLGFTGGQYVIVDTGVTLPNGKRAKRAYSILSSDEEQWRFGIAVKKLPAGPGSNAMHEMTVGSTLSFSGPWGKNYIADPTTLGRALVFATDTGITAAMGLARSRALGSAGQLVWLVWYVGSDEDFIAEPFVRASLGNAADRLVIEPALPIGHPERAAHARAVAFRHWEGSTSAFLSGDGAVVTPLREALLEAGLSDHHVRVETFFNSPQRRTP